MKYSKGVLALLLLSILTSFVSCSKSESDIPRVVIVGFSGIRGEDFKYINPILEKMKVHGTTYNHLINQNSEMHCPAFQSALSGVKYPWMSFKTQLTKPSIFHYVMKNNPKLDDDRFWALGMFTSPQLKFSKDDKYNRNPIQITGQPKDMASYYMKETYPKLKDILSEAEDSFFQDFIKVEGGWPNWDSFSDVIHSVSEKILKKKKPYIFFTASGAAESAHYGNFARYIVSIKEQINHVHKLWNFIQTDPFYKGKTYFIVFSDHYRDQYYMDHNENSIGNRGRNWLYVYGPGVQEGLKSSRAITHNDIYASLAKIYKLDPHEHEGKILTELFK